MAVWRARPEVSRIVDLDRLEQDLEEVLENMKTRSERWAPGLPLCRGAMLAGYLAVVSPTPSFVYSAEGSLDLDGKRV